MAHFWKDDKIYNIYTKNDPDEIPIVHQLCAKYFPHAKLVIGVKEDNNEIITLSGKGADMFVINGRKADPSFYKNNILHPLMLQRRINMHHVGLHISLLIRFLFHHLISLFFQLIDTIPSCKLL